ncbi:MAG: hypothetical protein Q9217_001433 [Psora testacea]
MGQAHSSPPKNLSREIEVIGCGMSRTGTLSFGLALEKLLNGPVYHGGEAIFKREEDHVTGWINILRHTPCKSAEDKVYIKDGLRRLLSGYIACTDIPPAAFTEELVEIYPNAKVICTVRDPGDWWRSMEPIVKNSKMGLLGFLFYLLPTLRWFTTYSNAMSKGRFGELYFKRGYDTCVKETYDYHMEYLRRVVPEEKLHFFDVKDGWQPLCKMLGKEVPDEPFPRANESRAIEALFHDMLFRGIVRWGIVVGVVSVGLALGWWYLL